MPLIFLNGKLVDESDAFVSVLDHGLVVGDGVFETILLRDGSAFALSRHLDRLQRSAAGLGIGPVDRAQLAEGVAAVVDSAEFPLGRIRITVTAGLGPLGSARLPGPPTVAIACSEMDDEHATSRVHVVPWSRNEHGALAGLKTTSYAENALALARAAEAGADEAIFANTGGMLCEGTGSNIFVVHDGELLTPPLSSGCLAGVTRALVLERIGGREEDLPMDALSSSALSEAFLTSTLRGVQPIAHIDHHRLPAPGPLTEKAMQAYAEILNEVDP